MRPAIWGLVFLAGCTCERQGDPPAREEAEEQAALEPPEPQEREADPFDDADRFQVYGYDLAPYGAARGTWRSEEINGLEVVRRVERREDGDALVTATIDGEPYLSVHIVDGVAYTMRRDRCVATGDNAAKALRRLPRRLVPVRRVEVPMYGLLGDGVPDTAAQPIEEDPPEGSLATTGRRFSFERDIALYQASVEGEVWLDAEGRPVQSKGRLEITPKNDDEAPSTASWEFHVEPGSDVSVEPPGGCEAVVERVALTRAFPRMEGGEPLLETPTSVAYRVPGTVDDAMAFYREALDEQGWIEERSKIVEQTGTLELVRDKQRIRVVARRTDEGITVLMSFAQ